MCGRPLRGFPSVLFLEEGHNPENDAGVRGMYVEEFEG